MKALAIAIIALAVLAAISLAIYAVVLGVRRGMVARRIERGKWTVRPRTLTDGTRQVWLEREGSDPFFYGQIEPDDMDRIDPNRWDKLLYGAEAQAAEFDRLQPTLRGD